MMYTAKAAYVQTHQGAHTYQFTCTQMHSTRTDVCRQAHTCRHSHVCGNMVTCLLRAPSADIHMTYMKPLGLFAHVRPESQWQHPPRDTELSLLAPVTFSGPVRHMGPQADPQCAVRR